RTGIEVGKHLAPFLVDDAAAGGGVGYPEIHLHHVFRRGAGFGQHRADMREDVDALLVDAVGHLRRRRIASDNHARHDQRPHAGRCRDWVAVLEAGDVDAAPLGHGGYFFRLAGRRSSLPSATRRTASVSVGRWPTFARGAGAATTRLLKRPSPVTSTSIRSPTSIGRELAGVPVITTSPGTNVMCRARSAMM